MFPCNAVLAKMYVHAIRQTNNSTDIPVVCPRFPLVKNSAYRNHFDELRFTMMCTGCLRTKGQRYNVIAKTGDSKPPMRNRNLDIKTNKDYIGLNSRIDSGIDKTEIS